MLLLNPLTAQFDPPITKISTKTLSAFKRQTLPVSTNTNDSEKHGGIKRSSPCEKQWERFSNQPK